MKNIRPNFAKLLALLIFIALNVLGSNQLLAQKVKEPLSFNDVRLWRTHSSTLSDNGQWYTIHYRLNDKANSKKDTVLQQLIEKTSDEFYTDNNKTEVLYIHNVDTGLKYEVPDGSTPKFSNDSKWLAYKIVKEANENDKDATDTTYIELKHLASDFTVRYKSQANYSFPEGKNYLLSSGKNDLLIYDLENRTEHFIGSVGEYLEVKTSNYIAYTIQSEDYRGNGIYLYDPQNRSTRTLTTGNFIYSNLAWNVNANALAAYKYIKNEEKEEYESIGIVVVEGINSRNLTTKEYLSGEIEGLPEDRVLAASPGVSNLDIIWSNDNKRLFVKLKAKLAEEKNVKAEDESTVQVWHWKDKKLLSERIVDAETERNKTYRAIFFRENNTVVPLTGEEIQNYIYSEGTDEWAIGTDNRKYLSDWDVNQHDLYRINLKTGEKKLIENGYRSRNGNQVQISPDGDKAILWDEKDYWFYDIANNTRRNITEDVPVSFIDTKYDRWGWTNNYGFVGWVKDKDAVIVNHEFDLWLIPIDEGKQAENLTETARGNESIRFRWEDQKSLNDPDPKERYLDLSKPQFLTAFDTETKYSGLYKLEKEKVSKIALEPAYYFNGWYPNQIFKAKNSDAILFRKGDVQEFFETYLTDTDFSAPRKLTNTNPHQQKYIWGKTILIDYKNDDGVPLQATLTLPENYKKGEKLPMIVYSYEKLSYLNYFYSTPRLGTITPTMLYVSNGYLYLEPDIHFNIGTPHSDMHESIDAAIEKVIELGYVDEKRIGYNGFSFGGHTGMYVATQNNRFAAISAGAGVSNLVQGFTVDIVSDGSSEQDYYMTSQGRLGTDPTSDTQMYIRESPVFNAQNMNTPLLLYHGTNDKVVQWEHSFGYYNLLRYLKKPVVLLSYRGEGHGLIKEANRIDFQRKLMDFFNYYLKDEEAKPWIIEELPYIPKKESKDDKNQTAESKWK